MTGYARSEVIDRTFWDIRLFPHPGDAGRLFDALRKDGRIRNHEIECLTRSGETRTGVMSAEIIELWDEQCMLSNIADITDNKRLEKEIMDSTEKERKRIGQDLHDDLCPHLIGIEALVKVLNKKLGARSDQETLLTEKIRSLIRDAIDKARNLTRGLLPVYLVDHGIESSIQELAKQVREVYGVSCRLSSKGAVALNDNTAATHLFYIVQEALHNAVKHAQAEEILIDLVAEEERILLNITDDGIGLPDLTDSKGMGMHIMGFRAKKINASLDIRQNGDRGAVVSIELRKNSGEGAHG
jgi:signal transduction histidine kinase